MARGRTTEDLSTLQMALIGYQFERQKIEDKIREIQAQLKGKKSASSSTPAAAEKSPGKRVLSPEARKRIAAAQKKRWAEHRRAKAQQSKET
jgi:hypothetical protein